MILSGLNMVGYVISRSLWVAASLRYAPFLATAADPSAFLPAQPGEVSRAF